MIIGVGTDIVQIPRVLRVFSLYGERFARRVLSGKELGRFGALNEEGKVNFLAKRFAAKEAIAKALGLGVGRGFRFCDITILNDDLGKPVAYIAGHCTKERFDIHLSISDDPPVCVAFAVISSRDVVGIGQTTSIDGCA